MRSYLGVRLRAATMIDSVDRCVVSTASHEIAEVACSLGGNVPFQRPAEFAADDTPTAPVLRHALAAVEEREGGRWVDVRPVPDVPGRIQRYLRRHAGVTRRPEMDSYLRINGNFYVWRAPVVRRMGDVLADEEQHGMVEIPESRAFAIRLPFRVRPARGACRRRDRHPPVAHIVRLTSGWLADSISRR